MKVLFKDSRQDIPVWGLSYRSPSTYYHVQDDEDDDDDDDGTCLRSGVGRCGTWLGRSRDIISSSQRH